MTSTTTRSARRASVLPEAAAVGIFRAPDAGRFVAAAEVLAEAGLTCLEFTMTSAGALEALVEAKRRLPGVLLGVGTVRTPDHLRAAADAGADFAVSQVVLPRLVATAAELGLSYVPGALTPTEIVTAWELDVPLVKVSPIGPLGGPDYLRELRGPLPDIALMPTGGVTVDNAADYLRLGAAAVGVSGSLVGDALTGGDLGALRHRADQLVASLR
ncbi:2-dehydro-3-deoxyphosphogluconate aldolase/(4S)-4-hydroxy-2-oxoglutarate aldolase [Friedmanniella endophytica]|uniref:2-dehydro-3-deoxyphosphogluconate aldolase/(4S)-4-hydroxy-2-oxoglutarate aldolase n=1 Tax=Microlunatus kandeliicorticis TaxID=1759536 RepID=A0A7W3IRW6_9ACTN|nr:bifunctional 4-hydroxy-2-oxoglutarate aldolase/2-dehydro-3-deoxy-phosphogluconate aldolase [Microlunatus kandeliicorticis]MBA8794138.1 2-dehydro-3-deoxyphosphogluconate aldolase/(4S)-4-hydroxy-2-oxoglutarate aldolase [Microlunatus kandeliicorticis]